MNCQIGLVDVCPHGVNSNLCRNGIIGGHATLQVHRFFLLRPGTHFRCMCEGLRSSEKLIGKFGYGFTWSGTCGTLSGRGQSIFRGQLCALIVPLSMRWLDMRRNRQVHRHGFVADGANLVELIDTSETHLAGPQNSSLTFDLKFTMALKDEKDLLSKIMRMPGRHGARFKAHGSRTDLRGNHDIAHIGTEVVDIYRHDVPLQELAVQVGQDDITDEGDILNGTRRIGVRALTRENTVTEMPYLQLEWVLGHTRSSFHGVRSLSMPWWITVEGQPLEKPVGNEAITRSREP